MSEILQAGTRDWIRPQDKLPPEGEVVNCINSVGHVTQLRCSGRLWFVPDGSMYVYYEPQFWQPAHAGEGEGKVKRKIAPKQIEGPAEQPKDGLSFETWWGWFKGGYGETGVREEDIARCAWIQSKAVQRALLTSPVAPTPRWENVTDAETGLSRNVPPVAPGEQPPPSGWLQALQQAELKPSAPPAVPAEALPNLWCAVCGRTTKHVQDTTDLAWWQCDVCSNKQRIGHTEKGYVAAEAQERASNEQRAEEWREAHLVHRKLLPAIVELIAETRATAAKLAREEALEELKKLYDDGGTSNLVYGHICGELVAIKAARSVAAKLAAQPSPQEKKDVG